ncbi:MAG: hypothetical protein PHD73_07750 [Sediminibacterium sp.]|nr:hypothetical protein [Sediminibacterium sp.]
MKNQPARKGRLKNRGIKSVIICLWHILRLPATGANNHLHQKEYKPAT